MTKQLTKDWLENTIKCAVEPIFDGQPTGKKLMKVACKMAIERIPDFKGNVDVDISFTFPAPMTVTLVPKTERGKLMIPEIVQFTLEQGTLR